MSLSDVPASTARVATADAAIAADDPAARATARAAKKQQQAQEHWTAQICRWGCATGNGALARKKVLVLRGRESMNSGFLATTKTDLEAKGYTVVEDGDKFTITAV